jgi:hypothetical protein
LLFGAAQVIVTLREDETYEIEVLVIGLGTVKGVAEIAFESGPFPIALTARILTG